MLVNDSRISNSMDSLEQSHNVACVPLYHRYYKGSCFREIRFPIITYFYVLSTRTSCKAHPFVIDCPVNRTMHYREDPFFASTAHLCPCRSFSLRHSLFPPSYNLFPYTFTMHCMNRGLTLSAGKKKKKFVLFGQKTLRSQLSSYREYKLTLSGLVHYHLKYL